MLFVQARDSWLNIADFCHFLCYMNNDRHKVNWNPHFLESHSSTFCSK